MTEAQAWTRLERYLAANKDIRLSLTYCRIGSEWFWQFVLYNEKGNVVKARKQAGERQAALEGLVEQLDVR